MKLPVARWLCGRRPILTRIRALLWRWRWRHDRRKARQAPSTHAPPSAHVQIYGPDVYVADSDTNDMLGRSLLRLFGARRITTWVTHKQTFCVELTWSNGQWYVIEVDRLPRRMELFDEVIAAVKRACLEEATQKADS